MSFDYPDTSGGFLRRRAVGRDIHRMPCNLDGDWQLILEQGVAGFTYADKLSCKRMKCAVIVLLHTVIWLGRWAHHLGGEPGGHYPIQTNSDRRWAHLIFCGRRDIQWSLSALSAVTRVPVFIATRHS